MRHNAHPIPARVTMVFEDGTKMEMVALVRGATNLEHSFDRCCCIVNTSRLEFEGYADPSNVTVTLPEKSN